MPHHENELDTIRFLLDTAQETADCDKRQYIIIIKAGKKLAI